MYCENCGSKLNMNNSKLCNNCGCKNVRYYGINELKKAFKYINIFLTVISVAVIILLSFSVYGYIKTDKMDASFSEMADSFYEYWSYEYNYGVENEGADLYRDFNRLAIDASISNIHYEKCVIFFGLALILLIITIIIVNVINRKRLSKTNDINNHNLEIIP